MIRLFTILTAAILAGGLGLAGWHLKLLGRTYWRVSFILAAALLLSTVLGLAPVGQVPASAAAGNTDIIFLVDITYSMNARDGRSGTARLSNARSDIQTIADKLTGSRFGIITFDSAPAMYLPLTTDTADISTAARTLETKDVSLSTQDPDMTGAFKYAASYLSQVAKVDTTRHRILVIMSDGELTGKTDTRQSVLAAAADLKKTVSGTVVIGYGSSTGTRLPYITTDLTTGAQVAAEGQYVLTPDDIGYVTSKSDPAFLQSLADTMQGTYLSGTGNPVPDVSRLRQAAAGRSAGLSGDATALRQNILHVPAALAIIAFLLLAEIVQWPPLRRFTRTWRRRP